MKPQPRKRPRARGWCQFVLVGCVMVIALIAAGVAFFLYHRPSKVEVTVTSTPAPSAATTASPAPSTTVAPASPSASAAPATFEAEWSGTLRRGEERRVPFRVDAKNVSYIAPLDLAKILTPKEYEKVHLKGGTLRLEDKEVGHVLKDASGDDNVPVTELFSAMDMKITIDKGALEGKISSAEAKTGK